MVRYEFSRRRKPTVWVLSGTIQRVFRAPLFSHFGKVVLGTLIAISLTALVGAVVYTSSLPVIDSKSSTASIVAMWITASVTVPRRWRITIVHHEGHYGRYEFVRPFYGSFAGYLMRRWWMRRSEKYEGDWALVMDVLALSQSWRVALRQRTITGVSWLWIDILLVGLLTESAGFHYMWSVLLATQCMAVFSYFRLYYSRLRHHYHLIFRTLILVLLFNAALVIRTPLILIMTTYLGLHYLVADALSILFLFAIGSSWTFSREKFRRGPRAEPENVESSMWPEAVERQGQ